MVLLFVSYTISSPSLSLFLRLIYTHTLRVLSRFALSIAKISNLLRFKKLIDSRGMYKFLYAHTVTWADVMTHMVNKLLSAALDKFQTDKSTEDKYKYFLE